MDTYEYEKYLTTKENLKETLEKYGVAIIAGVLSDEECENMKTNMWDYLEHITQHFETPMKRDDSSTWSQYSQLYLLHSMLLQRFNVGHCKMVWDLRQNEKIISIFSTLWNTPAEDLLVSFDGASFSFPPEKTKKGWYRNNSWLHTDQSYTRSAFECVQSWVTAYDVNPGDATLRFLEKSHLLHETFGKKFNKTDKQDWYKLEPNEVDFYIKQGCQDKSIQCKHGDMVFFDSRTIHQGKEPLKERPVENFRCVAYLCYTPRSRATQAALKKKIKAFEELRTTNHWPHKPKLFPVHPRTYGAALPRIEAIQKPELTPLGRRLCGYEK